MLKLTTGSVLLCSIRALLWRTCPTLSGRVVLSASLPFHLLPVIKGEHLFPVFSFKLSISLFFPFCVLCNCTILLPHTVNYLWSQVHAKCYMWSAIWSSDVKHKARTWMHLQLSGLPAAPWSYNGLITRLSILWGVCKSIHSSRVQKMKRERILIGTCSAQHLVWTIWAHYPKATKPADSWEANDNTCYWGAQIAQRHVGVKLWWCGGVQKYLDNNCFREEFDPC